MYQISGALATQSCKNEPIITCLSTRNTSRIPEQTVMKFHIGKLVDTIQFWLKLNKDTLHVTVHITSVTCYVFITAKKVLNFKHNSLHIYQSEKLSKGCREKLNTF
jgi:hypothetical protein